MGLKSYLQRRKGPSECILDLMILQATTKNLVFHKIMTQVNSKYTQYLLKLTKVIIPTNQNGQSSLLCMKEIGTMLLKFIETGLFQMLLGLNKVR